MEYRRVTTGLTSEPGIDGGLGRRNEPGWGTEPAIGVDSGDAWLEKVAASGGRMIRPKSAVPSVGWLAHCQATQSNRFSLMQNDQAARQPCGLDAWQLVRQGAGLRGAPAHGRGQPPSVSASRNRRADRHRRAPCGTGTSLTDRPTRQGMPRDADHLMGAPACWLTAEVGESPESPGCASKNSQIAWLASSS